MTRTFARKLIPGAILGAFSTLAGASAFQLLEQNASSLGNAYAGSAAIAENASTVFFNPAGMALLPAGKQVSLSLDMVNPSARFSNNGSIPPRFNTNTGGDGGDAGGWAAVPSGYFTMSLSPQWTFGLGIGAPFGLKTEYDNNWRGRFLATKSDVKTINISPALAYKVNDQVSLGLGLNYQKLDAELGSAANISALLCANPLLAGLCGAGLLNNLEAQVNTKGSDWAWGYNLGAIFQINDKTRLGISYRSSTKYHVTGNVNTSLPTVMAGGPISAPLAAGLNAQIAAGLANGPIKLDIELPETWTISGMYQLDDRWTLLGDIAWTGWSKIQSLDIYRSNTGALLSTTPENWRDTTRISLGANYRWSDTTKLRFGVAADQSPVGNDDYRTPRLPDNNRTWLSLGAQFKLDGGGVVDVGYSHLFVPNSTIRDNGHSLTNQAARGLLSGQYSNSVDILGLQYTFSF
ncbi:MAG: outer membrane protein transport protein [Proteobacteria bacterium]|nr:outer membrane protein transport protein [Pseudomonadota bacterium]